MNETLRKTKLRAYFYHEESHCSFIHQFNYTGDMWSVTKIGLCIKPSTKDFKLKVQKRAPQLKPLSEFYTYDEVTGELIDKSPF